MCFLFQSPPKGTTIPYRPKPPVGGPVILAGGQAYTIQGNYAVPAHTDVSTTVMTPLFAPTTTTHPLSPALAAAASHPLAPPAAIAPAQLVSFDPSLKNGHLQAALPPPAHLLPDVS